MDSVIDAKLAVGLIFIASLVTLIATLIIPSWINKWMKGRKK